MIQMRAKRIVAEDDRCDEKCLVIEQGLDRRSIWCGKFHFRRVHCFSVFTTMSSDLASAKFANAIYGDGLGGLVSDKDQLGRASMDEGTGIKRSTPLTLIPQQRSLRHLPSSANPLFQGTGYLRALAFQSPTFVLSFSLVYDTLREFSQVSPSYQPLITQYGPRIHRRSCCRRSCRCRPRFRSTYPVCSQ